MSQTLYLECYSGISGDMTVAELLDLGADWNVVQAGLKSLGVDGFRVKKSRVKKAGIDVCDFDVILDVENHDHDMEYLHGVHGHDVSCKHGHDHFHHQEHRGLREIVELIGHSGITDRAKETAVRIFTIIAEAEAKAHGLPVDQVHFHEVGAIDSIVDVVAVAVCLDNLDITEVIIKELYEGQGHIRCQHGVIPIPAPAVANIAAAHGLTLHITEVQGELVTPTGAAIAAAIRTTDTLPEHFTIERIGLGAGKRTYEAPGIVRAMLIKGGDLASDVIYRLETNIDDCSSELLGYVMEQLLKAGARDVSYTPVFMKKNRPAYQLNVICAPKEVSVLEKLIFRETTTIGIRRVKMERTVLPRRLKRVETSLGEVGIKICTLPEGVRIYGEYEDIARISRSLGRPYYEVNRQIQIELDNRKEELLS